MSLLRPVLITPDARKILMIAMVVSPILLSGCRGIGNQEPSGWGDRTKAELSPVAYPSNGDRSTPKSVPPPQPPRASLVATSGLAPASPSNRWPAPVPSPSQGSADPAIRQTSSQPGPEVNVPTIPQTAATLPIDLPTALRLADSANPIIGVARARIGEALGGELAAKVLLLPSLNGGGSYDGHAGVLQQSDGRVINVDRQSLYLGGGAYAVASSTVSVPAVNITSHLGDAIFEPLAAKQRVEAVRFNAAATANSVLLGVAVEYLELEAAGLDVLARGRTESEAAEVARVTAEFARTGAGRLADADRAETQKHLRRGEIRKAEERLAVASARLARRLHLDPSVRIEPANTAPEVFALVDPDIATEKLLEVALQRRPEVKSRDAEVAVAETRTRQEKMRPLLPTVWLGYSGAAFGGGSNLTPPLLGRFGSRTDFDAYAFWTLLNFGAGNATLVKQRNAQLGGAVADRDATINLVREEVASARSEALADREQLRIAVEELDVAQDGYAKDLERIQQAAGPPLEVLNNLGLLGKARESVINAVLGYNQAQFRLFVAMGSPPPLELPTQPPLAQSTLNTLTAAPVESPTRAAAHPAGLASPSPKPASDDAGVAVATNRASQPGGASDAVKDGFTALATAKRGAITATTEYERLQAEIYQAIGADPGDTKREDLLIKLSALAKAHRAETTSRLEYDQVLWHLIDDLKAHPLERTNPGTGESPTP